MYFLGSLGKDVLDVSACEIVVGMQEQGNCP